MCCGMFTLTYNAVTIGPGVCLGFYQGLGSGTKSTSAAGTQCFDRSEDEGMIRVL